jgi:hypothetical protein
MRESDDRGQRPARGAALEKFSAIHHQIDDLRFTIDD